MAGKVEELSVKVEISPFQEMDGKTKRWCLDNTVLKKKLQPIVFQERMDVDTRKWDQKGLEEELAGYARFDLKLLDVVVIDCRKEIEKAPARNAADALDKAEKKICASYDRIEKEILKKMARAAEELSGGGDNSQALAQGKAALKKLESVDFEIVFTEAAANARTALDTLSGKVKPPAPPKGKDGEEAADPKAEQGAAKALTECSKKLAEVGRNLKASSEEAMSALEFLQKVGRKIKDNRAASPEMNAFGALVEKTSFADFTKAVDKFQAQLDEYANDVKGGGMSDRQVNAMSEAVGSQSVGVRIAKSVTDTIKDLSKKFRALEKDLA